MNFKIEITQTPAGIDFNIIGNPTVEKVTQKITKILQFHN